MKKLFLGLFGCITASLNASLYTEWVYGRAICSAQEGQWADAQQRMSRLTVNDPDNPELLYDNGVAAYRLKEYQKAHAYFQQTTQNKRVCAGLKEKAYFNLGNTQVALNTLQEAVDSYESALKIDSHDEHARYNLEKVRELLKKNEKQQQQNNRSKSEQSPQRKQQDQASDDHQKQGEQEEQEKQQQSSKGQENKSDGNEHQKQDADQQQEGESPGDANDKSNGDSRDQEQKQSHDTHDTSPQKTPRRDNAGKAKDSRAHDAETHHTKEGEKSQGMQTGALDEQGGGEGKQAKRAKKVEDEFAPHERWMARLLRQRERADEKANKQIVKAMIDKELAGKDGQNCW